MTKINNSNRHQGRLYHWTGSTGEQRGIFFLDIRNVYVELKPSKFIFLWILEETQQMFSYKIDNFPSEMRI